jgi:hypothetical protein
MDRESVFFREWLATRYNNQLPISAVCNSRCIFCSNRQNPFEVKGGIFRDIEDIKHQLSLMPHHNDPLYMSDSLPGRIAEGEAFLHPDLFQILSLVRCKYTTNMINFTTNASMLEEAFLKRLSTFRPIEITVSMHSTRPELWAAIFRKSEPDAVIAIKSLELIRKHRMELAGAIVPLPKICGWDDIEQTYANFSSYGAKKMTLYWPGYTERTLPEVIEDLRWPVEESLAFVDRLRARYNIPLSSFPELRGSLNIPVKEIMTNTLKGNKRAACGPYGKVLWLASEAAYGRVKELVEAAAESFPNQHRVCSVKNLTYGGNILVAGLLTVEDFIIAGKVTLEAYPDTDLVLVPKRPFDNLYQDLVLEPAYKIAEELKKPVWIINDDASFNPLLSRLFFKKGDSVLEDLAETLQAINRVWQDGGPDDKLLNWVDAYPIATPWGLLDPEQHLRAIQNERRNLPKDPKPLRWNFDLLDADHAQCVETWPTKDASTTFQRWTFLVRRESAWKISEIRQGELSGLARGQ